MDIGTLGGLIFGASLILWSIISGGSLSAFVDVPSMCITIGGTVCALLITFPLPKISAVMRVTQKTINAGSLDLAPWYSTMIDLGTIARRDGILALEERMDGVSDDFLRRGLQMIIDGSPADTVAAIMQMEIENMEERHSIGHDMWKAVGNYAPAFGMIGTLIGLIQMLQNMSDPSKLGAGMAVALITTFYGALMANLVAIPLQGKLEQRTAEEVHLKKMLLAGVLSIQAGDSPRMIGDKLAVYLTPAQRAANIEQNKKAA